ncbi:hypothetical protein C9374_001623 [Naegleria lovaniensis]|uniref:Uncharacterized protein n=1 Tax=Naegleria lovaniensis TaxID=51637 RepID=A0AA88GWP2_NAELO|nr:uncharacterized protein C9374_001623 [Naegleria lovaniensis]KAG2387291.1 hypothetical protein C9374_001623 [Naegleria lovaniensis]
METRDVKFMFNYVSKVAKHLNLRPEIVASRGIKFDKIPAMVEQLQSREENIEDAKHLNYLKESLFIYELPIFNHEDILAGKHKNIAPVEESNEEEVEEASHSNNEDEANQHDNSNEDDVNESETTETSEPTEEPPSEKQQSQVEKIKSKDKKSKKKNRDGEDDVLSSKKKEKSKGIQKPEKMKEKLHKKK